MPDDAVVSHGRRPTDYDHNSREHGKNWPENYRVMREQSPRAWTENYGGFWIATKYKDIIRIAQRPDSFSTHKTIDPVTGEAHGGASIPPMTTFRAVPTESESPEWNMVRTFINRRYAPQAVEKLRPQAQQWAAALVDQVIEKGHMDIVEDIANPLPALMTMDMFGFSLHEWRDFADLFHKIGYLTPDEAGHVEAMNKLNYFLRHRVDEEIAIRREHPRDDLFSYMAHGVMGGKPLDRDMIHNLSFNLIGGGVGTTSALTSNTLRYLAHNPKDRQRLIDEPSLMPIATEEFVRYFSIVQGNPRTVKHDVDVDGWKFQAGDRVMVAFSSANRDAEVFDNPEKVVLDRLPNRHIGFGAGMHRCLGSFLARMMFQAMIGEVITRIPDYKVVEAESERYPSIGIANGWIRMPATFTPGHKIGARMPA